MIGAIAGDIIGSVYEWNPVKYEDFPLFSEESHYTDDTVCTIALADSIMNKIDYVTCLHRYYDAYPDCGFGGMFLDWASQKRIEPYNSWGNGSAMRVSPIGFAFNDKKTVLQEAEKSAAITHNHPEGIKGAQATALAIFMARTHESKDAIRDEISNRFHYNLDRTLAEIRPTYHFDVSCQGTVPEAILSFLESDSFEDAIRKAVSLGGDSDTLACITGGIAEAFYGGVPESIKAKVDLILDDYLGSKVAEFEGKIGAGVKILK